MTAVYELRIFSPTGALLKRVSDFLWLSCAMRVNSPGMIQAGLPTGDPADSGRDAARRAVIASLTHRGLVELWRKDDAMGVDWQRFFGGLFLSQERTWEGNETFTLTAPGYLWLLKTRIVNWPADTANRTLFTAAYAETIMKTLVSYNAGASATVANGRKRAGALTGLTVEADSARGLALDWTCPGDNLLETLQKIAPLGGGDFDLTRQGAAGWQFQYFNDQRGADRTGTVIFSMGRANMGSPQYVYNRIDEATTACVWGQGEGALRQYLTRTGADWAVDNDNEIFVNASDVETTSASNARGDNYMSENRAREVFTFKVQQTPSCQFGRHYNLGDLVTVVNPFTGASSTQKVSAVTLGLAQDGAETLDIEVTTP